MFIVCTTLMDGFNVLQPLQIDETMFHALMLRVEASYITENTYHNAIHAADVTQGMAYFIGRPFFLPHLTAVEKFAAILAAAIHDLAHPGVNNAFCVATDAAVALTYNDNAVLENMHVAKFFKLVMSSKLNIFKVRPAPCWCFTSFSARASPVIRVRVYVPCRSCRGSSTPTCVPSSSAWFCPPT